MCDLSYGVYSDGLEEGNRKGREEEREKGREKAFVESIRRMMAKLKLSAEKAMEIPEIPEAEWPKYREALDK